jgi:hypothetical protein
MEEKHQLHSRLKRNYRIVILLNNEKSFPIMDGIALAKEIISEVNRKVKRTDWTNEQIDRLFGRRSAQEILKDGTTCFMNPCLDLTLVSAYLMSSKNIPHQFIIEEYLPIQQFNFNRLHFAIEFQTGNENYALDYKKNNEVNIIKGKYNGRSDLQKVSRIFIPGEIINPFKTINESLGYSSLEDLTKDKFTGYSLEKNLNRLKQDNFKENYEMYQRVYGEEFKILIESQNQP